MRPTPPPPNKRKNTSPLRVIVNQWGCLLALIMLGLGAVVGLLGAIFVGPQLLGFDLTATALGEQEIVLAATKVELDEQAQDAISRATSFALDVQSTQAILNNNADLLAQTATQSAQNISATATANANLNVQRQTQVANDFASTQAALNANATQVELDFRNTQSALGIDTTQAQTDNNLATPSARYSFDFSQFTFSTTAWQLSSDDNWRIVDIGIEAIAEGAYLVEAQSRILPNNNFSDSYTVTADIRPAISTNAEYWLIFGLDNTRGYVAHFVAETLNVTQVSLYQFEASQLETSLLADELTIIRRQASNITLNSQSQLSVLVIDEQVAIQIDDQTLLTVQELEVPIGAIGVQLPQGAILRAISVADQ